MATTTIDREKYKDMRRKAEWYDALFNKLEDMHYDTYYNNRIFEQPCSKGELIELGKIAADHMGFLV